MSIKVFRSTKLKTIEFTMANMKALHFSKCTHIKVHRFIQSYKKLLYMSIY
jgi:hypothetical protein